MFSNVDVVKPHRMTIAMQRSENPNSEDQQPDCRALLALKLPAVFHSIACRHWDGRANCGADVGNDASEIPARDTPKGAGVRRMRIAKRPLH